MRFMRCAILALFAGLYTAQAAATDAEFPEALPESVGVDSRSLVKLSQWIRDERLDVRAVLVVKDGRLVFERYSEGVTREHNHAVYSVTKSVTSLLIGMLVDDGRIDSPKSKVAEILARMPQADRVAPMLDGKHEVEVGHVLSMGSGLRYQHDPERNPIYAAPDRLAQALSVPVVAPPGTKFQYSDGDATIAGALVVAASGRSLEAFARDRLFRPLTMRNVEWPGIDSRGLHPGGWALRLRAIDMAKLGQLMLDDGIWEGRRLVSRSWLQLATMWKVAPTYGYFWWVGNFGERGVSAEGFKGQRIIALSRRNLVIVIAAVFPRGREIPLVARMVHEFIVPATEPGEALAPSDELREALSAELNLARQTRGDSRNTLEWQDTPRR